MNDSRKTKAQLIEELEHLRAELDKLKASGGDESSPLDERILAIEKYQDLYDNAPGMYLSIDAETTEIVRCNRAVAEFTGYSMEELIGRSVFDVYHPSCIEEAKKAFAELVKIGELRDVELQVLKKDGGIRYVSLSATSVLDETGVTLLSRSLWHDITEIKRMMDDLRRERDFVDSIFRTAPEIILVLDADGNIESFNPFLETLSGYALEEVKGANWFETFIPDYDHQKIADVLDKTIYGYNTTGTINPIKTRDGREIYIEWSNTNLENERGQIIGTLSIGRDITERMQYEQLQKLQRELATALGSISSMSEAFNHLLDTLLKIEGIDCGGVYIVDERTGNLKLAAHKGLTETFVTESGFYTADSPNARLVHAGEPVYAYHPDMAINRGHLDCGLLAIAVLPVHFKGEVVACLNVASHTVDEIPQFVRNCLESIAAQIGGVVARVKAEAALRISEEKYRTVVENANEGIVVYQDDERVLFNPKAAELSGYTAEEFIETNPDEMMFPEDVKTMRERLARRLAGEDVPDCYEMRFLQKSGRIIWVLMNAANIEWEGRPAAIYFYSDITERKSIEIAFRESERKYRELFENASEGIVVIQDGRRVFYNKKAVEIAGLSIEEYNNQRVFDYVHPDDREMVRRNYERRIKDGNAPSTYEFRSIDGTGQVRWNSVNGVRIEWEGRPASLIFVSNITEQKWMQQALRDSESEKSVILDSVNELVAYQDRDLNIIWANRAAAESVGREPIDMVGEQCYKVWNNRADPCPGCPVLEVIKTGNPCEREMTHPDGKTWIIKGYPVKDEQGRVTSVVEVTWEITEQKKAEQALRESENRYRTLFNGARDAIFIADVETGLLIDANKQAEKLLLKPIEEIIGMHQAELHPVEAQEKWKAQFKAHANSMVNEAMDAEIVASDGRIIPAELSASVVEVGGRKLLQGIFRDVSERKRAEQALRDSEARLASIFRAAPICIGVVMDRVLRMVNNHMCELLGYSRDELIGKSARMLYNSDEDFERVGREKYTDIEKYGTGSIETRWKCKDGSLLHVILSSTPLDPSDLSKGVTFTAQDITDRVLQEEERRRLEAQLQHAQKLESLGVLAGGIAHDFNNILVGILGFAELAQLELTPESPAMHSLKQIERSALHAAELTKQMLAYSGKGQFVVEPLNASRLITEMEHLLAAVVSKKANLKFNLDNEISSIEGDASQIRQVVLNLVTNASEALEDRSGVITVSTGMMECGPGFFAGTYLKEKLPEGIYTYIEVTDTGVGMSKETLSKIFDPFFTTKFTGRGLGLAATLGIMRGHAGAIEVNSEPGRGTTFRMLFPVSERTAGETVEETVAKDAWRGEGLILIVDDEESVRAVARLSLEKAGFEVQTASNGVEGLELFKRHMNEISLVLLDMTMPRMSGEETFAEMRKINPGVKVLLTSGYNEQDATSRFTGMGLAGFIQKPFRPTALVKKIHTILDG